MTPYAFVLVHFGDNIKYLEYELYSIIMLKSISKYDIVYLCNKNDTSKKFTRIVKNLVPKF